MVLYTEREFLKSMQANELYIEENESIDGIRVEEQTENDFHQQTSKESGSCVNICMQRDATDL